MIDRIALTAAEFRAVSDEVYKHSSAYVSTEHIVDLVVAAINKVRVGDPVGTIRRTDGGVIALRVDGGQYPWKAFSRCGLPAGTWTNEQVAKWTVVFQPEVS